jgi:hypothetical protein
MLNGHVLLRIGGGWDTLEHYLLTHMPKVGKQNTELLIVSESVSQGSFPLIANANLLSSLRELSSNNNI